MEPTKRLVEKGPATRKDDLIVITGAGGFIGGNLALYFTKKGFTNIRMNGICTCPAPKTSAWT